MNKKKIKLTIFLSSLFCLLLNFQINQSIHAGFINSILLGLSIYFAFESQKTLNKIPLHLVFTLSFIPLFYFVPFQMAVYIFMTVPVLFWLIALKLPRYKYFACIIGLIIFFSGALISNGLLSNSLEVNPQRIVWKVEETNSSIIYHQQSDIYIKYRIRLLFFNKSIYVYSILTNIAGILSLRNLYDTLLLANIYPLILGIREAYKFRDKLINKIMLWGVGLTFLAAGIARSPDKFSSFFVAVPVLTTLIILGFGRVNKLVYVTLLIFSLFLATTPII